MNPNLKDLVVALIEDKHHVAIETNGTYDSSILERYWGTKKLFVACSPKPETNWEMYSGLP